MLVTKMLVKVGLLFSELYYIVTAAITTRADCRSASSRVFACGVFSRR